MKINRFNNLNENTENISLQPSEAAVNEVGDAQNALLLESGEGAMPRPSASSSPSRLAMNAAAKAAYEKGRDIESALMEITRKASQMERDPGIYDAAIRAFMLLDSSLAMLDIVSNPEAKKDEIKGSLEDAVNMMASYRKLLEEAIGDSDLKEAKDSFQNVLLAGEAVSDAVAGLMKETEGQAERPLPAAAEAVQDKTGIRLNNSIMKTSNSNAILLAVMTTLAGVVSLSSCSEDGLLVTPADSESSWTKGDSSDGRMFAFGSDTYIVAANSSATVTMNNNKEDYGVYFSYETPDDVTVTEGVSITVANGQNSADRAFEIVAYYCDGKVADRCTVVCKKYAGAVPYLTIENGYEPVGVEDFTVVTGSQSGDAVMTITFSMGTDYYASGQSELVPRRKLTNGADYQITAFKFLSEGTGHVIDGSEYFELTEIAYAGDACFTCVKKQAGEYGDEAYQSLRYFQFEITLLDSGLAGDEVRRVYTLPLSLLKEGVFYSEPELYEESLYTGIISVSPWSEVNPIQTFRAASARPFWLITSEDFELINTGEAEGYGGKGAADGNSRFFYSGDKIYIQDRTGTDSAKAIAVVDSRCIEYTYKGFKYVMGYNPDAGLTLSKQAY